MILNTQVRRSSLHMLLYAVMLCPAASTFAKVQSYLKKSEPWYHSDEAREIAAHVLSYQSGWGGWPKNTDTAGAAYASDPLELHPTFDNTATMDELRFLARMFNATKDAHYRTAFERGLDYTLVAQYPTGGWPQSYPPDDLYHREITFNDNAMVRVLEFVREVYSSNDYAFVPQERRDAARDSFARGIDCILKCQVLVNGKPTAWCAQHDEEDYSPQPGRSFELKTLSGSESVGITRLLMSLEHPTPAVIKAVDAAVAWFRIAALHGIKVETVSDPASPKGTDKRVVQDKSAPPIWARFYEIGTNKPVFSDRDGVAKYKLDEIGYERRNGYSWLGSYPDKLLATEYPEWKATTGRKPGPTEPPSKPKVKIALAGDVTMTDHEGWAFGFKKQLTLRAVCLDLTGATRHPPHDAISDAKTFGDVQTYSPLPAKKREEYLSNPWWKQVVKTKPDYLLLQFRGNEVSSKTEAGNPTVLLSHEIAAAVAKAKAAGIKPVLVTALPKWESTSEGKIEPASSSTPALIKKIAQEQRVPLIDLNTQSIELVKRTESIGGLFHIAPLAPDSNKGTATSGQPKLSGTSSAEPVATLAPMKREPAQLKPEGRETFGALVAEELRGLAPELKPCFR